MPELEVRDHDHAPRQVPAREARAAANGQASREYVQSLARGLAVIRAFDASRPRLTLTEVAELTELPKATARRFLHTLAQLGYVEVIDRLFALRPRILELGFSYLSSMTLPEIAQPHMERLARSVGESVSLSVLDGVEIVYVGRVASGRIISVDLAVGARLPAYVTSMGRVLLAALPDDDVARHVGQMEHRTEQTITSLDALRAELARVREQGWALVDEELEEGLRSLAAPVCGPGGEVIAAINVSTAARRRPAEVLVADHLAALLGTARQISADFRDQGRAGGGS